MAQLNYNNLKREALLFSTFAIIFGATITAFALSMPLPRLIYPDNLIARPIDFISAMLFAISFILILKRYLLKKDIFSGMLLACILINIGGQVYMSLSKQLFDIFFDTAHWANLLSYCMPVVGITIHLLQEMKNSMREVTERGRAEEELKQQAAFAKNDPAPVLQAEYDGKITRFNPAAKKIFTRNLNGESLHNFFSGVSETFIRNLSSKPVQMELKIGDKIFLFTLKKDETTCSLYIYGSNITEQKRSEKEVKEAGDFLENIFKTSVDGIMVTSERGEITRVNEGLTKMLGYTSDELIGTHTAELALLEEGYLEYGTEYVNKLFEEGVVTGAEFNWRRKDGTIINVELNSSLLKDKEGNFTGSVASIRDITERKKFEKALTMSEEKYRGFIENAHDAIISTNGAGLIIDFNKRAEDIFGYLQEEIVGKPSSLLTTPDKRENDKEALEDLRGKREQGLLGRTIEGKGARKDGQIIPIESSIYTTEVEGEFIVTAFVRDISERKELERTLLQSEKLRSLGELAGGVAHDFNNVLAAILGRVQLLKMRVNLEKTPGKQERRKSVQDLKKSLEIIEQASLDGAETVRRIQEFSRRRDDDKYFTAVDINEVIDNALDFVKVRWKDEAESKGIKINIKKELSPLPLTAGSASELREVFTNLLNNAIDAMPEGDRLKINSFKENGHIAVTIKDTGTGIPKTAQDRIFDPFFTTKGVQATGLGLSVSFGIINRHRGAITLASAEGKGTTFTISLPISDKIEEEKEEKKLISDEQRKARILIVEDEKEVRVLLSDILADGGHKPKAVANGNEGIKLFEKNEFDLVFTDLGMPGISGWQVAEKVKSINRKVPVILVTGWNVKPHEAETKKSGIDIVIQKPFKVDQVLRVVQEGMMLRDQLKAG